MSWNSALMNRWQKDMDRIREFNSSRLPVYHSMLDDFGQDSSFLAQKLEEVRPFSEIPSGWENYPNLQRCLENEAQDIGNLVSSFEAAYDSVSSNEDEEKPADEHSVQSAEILESRKTFIEEPDSNDFLAKTFARNSRSLAEDAYRSPAEKYAAKPAVNPSSESPSESSSKPSAEALYAGAEERQETAKGPGETVAAGTYERQPRCIQGLSSKGGFSDLLDYYRSRGVVGEEKLCIFQTLCAINGIHFGIEGKSGSGKTFVVDALLDILPENSVYEIGLSSDTAVFKHYEKINDFRFIYIPELQKAMRKRSSNIVELIKDLTEGKDSKRIVTGKSGNPEEYLIKAGKTVIYTLADENNFKQDMETKRRFTILRTDCSDSHINAVLEKKASSRFGPQMKYNPENEALLKSKILSLVNSDCHFIDPYAGFAKEYLPLDPNIVSGIEAYYNLIDSSAKFHKSERLKIGNSVFVDLQDHFNAYMLNHDTEVNWSECHNFGIAMMAERYPYLLDKWAEQQTVVHPLSGEVVYHGD